MDAVTSHSTRSTFKFLLPMVVPSAIAAIASALMFSHFHEKSAEESERLAVEQLSVVAQGVSEQIQVAAQGYQALVGAAALSNPDVLNSIPGIRFYSSFKGQQSPQFTAFYSKTGNTNTRRLQIETALSLETVKAFQGVGLGKGTSKIVFARPDAQQSREWVGFFYVYEKDSVSGIWIDPVDAFLIARKKSEVRSEAALVKIALVTLKGRVLSASVPEYSGGDFSGVRGFSEFIQDPTSEVPSVDDWSVRVFKRVPQFPFAVIVEKVEERNSGWIRAARDLKDPAVRTKLLGYFILFCGAWGLITFAIAWNWSRSRSEAPQSISAAPASIPAPEKISAPAPVVEAPKPVVTAPIQEAYVPVPEKPVAPKLETIQPPAFTAPKTQPKEAAPASASMPAILDQAFHDEWKLRKFLDEEKLISDFERRSFIAKTPREVSEQLVLVATELCKSPALYFAFYRPTGQMILQAHAGLEAVGSLPALAFPMPNPATSVSKVSRLEEYGPLQNLILARFGTAHFEAHPVTAFGTLGRIAQRPQILGVLVVLQSNVDSALHQESLSRLMRTTGLIYENAVLAQ